jgi:histidinol dehydrogenase
MKIIRYPDKNEWSLLLERPAMGTGILDTIVTEVLERVKKEGDKAIIELTEKFDKVRLDSFIVSDQEKDSAEKSVSKELKLAIDLAALNIRKFHEAQKPSVIEIETMPGVLCKQIPVPIEKIGLYVPGGTAPLFSTVLMLAIPAQIAGCSEIILCSPPGRDGKLNPAIVYAASISGVKSIFTIGGIQAIGAMAFGTELVPKVFKIFGPGNQYVTAAKQLVARNDVAIDIPAGPSEVAVLVDKESNPEYVASDLLSQAEHGVDSQVILVSNSEEMITRVQSELKKQLDSLPRKDFAAQSLEHSKAYLVKDNKEMMDLVNAYAPEHLIISTCNADELAFQVKNAGSVFIGEYSPESAGDYASGTNHTLPTNGSARSYSGVNLDAYFKKITFQKLTREGLQRIGTAVETMALAEELIAHQRTVAIRLRNKF